MLLNAILAIALLKVMGWIAVAVAASASAWVTLFYCGSALKNLDGQQVR